MNLNLSRKQSESLDPAEVAFFLECRCHGMKPQNHQHSYAAQNIGLKFKNTYFPFLIVFLPSRGSRTGSIVSSRFSTKMTSPKAKAVSMAFKNLKIQSE